MTHKVTIKELKSPISNSIFKQYDRIVSNGTPVIARIVRLIHNDPIIISVSCSFESMSFSYNSYAALNSRSIKKHT